MYVEKYSHVMHLVSALEGHLRDDLDASMRWPHASLPAR